jgi:adenylate kinase family enzyme
LLADVARTPKLKIAVIGSPGSGKTYLANHLADELCLPLYSLDSLYFQANWEEPTWQDWSTRHDNLLTHPCWIIEGNNLPTLNSRVAASDIVVLFDLPPWLCCLRILRRWVRYRNHPRPGMPEGCTERLDLPFLKRAWKYRSLYLPFCVETCRQHLPNERIVLIRKKSELPQALKTINGLNRVEGTPSPQFQSGI